ncbi:MAG TPA: allantoinase AllB [Chitinophagaceae bacterium]|nr:allantoinase AllB [Chitinophagaceae bacterium]
MKKIYSNQCWVGNQLQAATISFENDIITNVEFRKEEDAEDVGENILMPGVIDVHVHINEPGRSDWEGFDTATKAAAAGGSTTIVDMPLNSSPVTTTLKDFNAKLFASVSQLHINCGFYGGLIPGSLYQLEKLIDAGILGIKCFLTDPGIEEFPPVIEKDLDKAMPIIAKHNLPLLVHCEIIDKEVDRDPITMGFADNPTSYKHFLASRPEKWEHDAIDLMIRLCRKHNCRVHIVHVSSGGSLKKIEKAKQEGLPLTAETCPHYIYFNAENIQDAHCIYKCIPPIRGKKNNDLLKHALQNGILDFISSDHSPASPSVKEIETGNLKNAWGGIAGLQFLLPASWTALKESLSLEEFIPLITTQPAKFINEKNRGEIKPGNYADLVIWDPGENRKVNEEDILFRHKISPYIGEELSGTIQQTIVNGETVFQKGGIIHQNKGKWLLRK